MKNFTQQKFSSMVLAVLLISSKAIISCEREQAKCRTICTPGQSAHVIQEGCFGRSQATAATNGQDCLPTAINPALEPIDSSFHQVRSDDDSKDMGSGDKEVRAKNRVSCEPAKDSALVQNGCSKHSQASAVNNDQDCLPTAVENPQLQHQLHPPMPSAQLDQDDWTPLHRAALKGDSAEVLALIAAGSGIEVPYKDGRTPLQIAAQCGHTAVVDALIVHRAIIEAANENGSTSLHHAAWGGHKAVVDALIRADAKKDAAQNGGWTPLHWAARNGHDDVVQALLAKGADKEAANNDYGCTPLSWAARNGHEGVVDALLAADAKVNAEDKNRTTSLHWAAHNGHEAIVKALVRAGANKDAVDKDRRTPLKLAQFVLEEQQKRSMPDATIVDGLQRVISELGVNL